MSEETAVEVKENSPKKEKKPVNKTMWMTIGAIALVLVIAGAAGGGYLLHLSDTSPEFCGTCHLMDKNVDSYLTSNHLDNLHYQAGVQCKECHDYPIPAEISSGIKYITGDYEVGSDGELKKVSYGSEMCLDCHISYERLGVKTDYLKFNPHNNHNGEMACRTCHVSHGDQIDYCSSCHINGGQRMIEDDPTERGKIQ